MLEIYKKYCGKEEKLLLGAISPLFYNILLIVRFLCLSRDKIFTSG